MKNCFSTKGRPARTPPPTFLFLPIHLSNSPGSGDPPLRLPEEPSKQHMHPSTIGCRFTVPVRSFRGAPSRRKRTARRWVVYRRRPAGLSTGIQRLFRTATDFSPSIYRRLDCRQNNTLIQTAPHSGHIPGSSLRLGSRDGIANGGIQPPSSGQLTRLPGRH